MLNLHNGEAIWKPDLLAVSGVPRALIDQIRKRYGIRMGVSSSTLQDLQYAFLDLDDEVFVFPRVFFYAFYLTK